MSLYHDNSNSVKVGSECYVQSQQHGPAYLFSVALPSLQSAAIYTMTGIPHRTRWFEADASYKGSAYFDRYYGSGKEGYTAGSPEFFDKYSFAFKVKSPYHNSSLDF